MLFQFVAKGERGHPTWIYTWVYRVPNMHSDCHTNEPGSIVWQSEHTLICSDGTSSHCPPLREVHSCASRTQVFLAHPPTVLLPSRAPHTGVNLPGGPTHSITGTPLMTSQRAIPLLTA